AAVAELQAAANEAAGNAERSRELREKGFYSPQLNTQYQTAEHTAAARLAAMEWEDTAAMEWAAMEWAAMADMEMSVQSAQ
ncbi:MAG TPA: efflux transporter periplasmic adaptor subunit, partial [Bacillota bacterium]|nr:efflux transporter periplasmic adaptor subunit [Bacillota bacterium]